MALKMAITGQHWENCATGVKSSYRPISRPPPPPPLWATNQRRVRSGPMMTIPICAPRLCSCLLLPDCSGVGWGVWVAGGSKLHPFSSGSVVKTPFYALASLKLSFTQSASPPIFQNVVVPGQSLAAGKVPAHGCSELN